MFPFSHMMTAGGTPLTASVSPATASGSRLGAGGVSTNAVTVTPNGGVPPYSCSWSAPGFTVNAPSALTTTFSRTLTNGASASGTATYVVTDAAGQTASGTVSLSVTSNPQLEVSVSPGSVNTASSGPGAGPFDQVFTCSTAHGSGNYTYSWFVSAQSGGASATFTTSTSAPSVNVRWSNPMPNGSGDVPYVWIRCAVQDNSTGQNVQSNNAIIVMGT